MKVLWVYFRQFVDSTLWTDVVAPQAMVCQGLNKNRRRFRCCIDDGRLGTQEVVMTSNFQASRGVWKPERRLVEDEPEFRSEAPRVSMTLPKGTAAVGATRDFQRFLVSAP